MVKNETVLSSNCQFVKEQKIVWEVIYKGDKNYIKTSSILDDVVEVIHMTNAEHTWIKATVKTR